MLEANPSVDSRIQDGVAVITLNRPDRFNAITIPMMQRLHSALVEADADERVGCVVLTALGRGFCGGQDLKVLLKYYEHNHPSGLGDMLAVHYNAVVEQIHHADKPVIAAVQGVAAGAGWSLALACDLCFAAESARFVPAFIRLGLVPDLGGTRSLIDAVGYNRAMEYALLTDVMTAQQAQAFGLINRVTPDAELMPAAMQAASRISTLPREGVVLTKRALRAALCNNLDVQLRCEAWYQAMGASAAGHVQRVEDFVNKKS